MVTGCLLWTGHSAWGGVQKGETTGDNYKAGAWGTDMLTAARKRRWENKHLEGNQNLRAFELALITAGN